MSTDNISPRPSPGRGLPRPGRRAAISVAATGLVLGGVAGGYMVTHVASAAAPSVVTTASSSTATPAPSTARPAPGTFHSNESAAHEAGESAAREAQENSGVFPGGPGGPGGAFHPNESASHEAGESAAREAQENAGQRPTVP